jgi:hypothetical protein
MTQTTKPSVTDYVNRLKTLQRAHEAGDVAAGLRAFALYDILATEEKQVARESGFVALPFRAVSGHDG